LRIIEVIASIGLVGSNFLIVNVAFFVVVLLVIIFIALFGADEHVRRDHPRIRSPMVIPGNLTCRVHLYAARERSCSWWCRLPTVDRCTLFGGV